MFKSQDDLSVDMYSEVKKEGELHDDNNSHFSYGTSSLSSPIPLRLVKNAFCDNHASYLPSSSPDDTCTANTSMDSQIKGNEDWIKREPIEGSDLSTNGELDMDQSGANRPSPVCSEIRDSKGENADDKLLGSSETFASDRVGFVIKSEVRCQMDEEPSVQNKSVSGVCKRKVFCGSEEADHSEISAQDPGPGSHDSGQDLKQEFGQMLKSSSETHPCPQCEAVFSTSWLVESHINHCHIDTLGKNRTEHTVENGNIKKSYRCDICDRDFFTGYKLKNHMKTHTGERPFKCDACGKEFSLRSNFKVHQRIHTGDKRFKCDECGKDFIRGYQLKEHMNTHTGERPHKCDECGKDYVRRYELKKHMKTHTGERAFKCDECGMDFMRRHQLKDHVKIHTEERAYKCGECGMDFIRIFELKWHMKVHTGERPHKCDECGKGFIRKSELKEHMKIHTGERPHKCIECGKGFIRKSEMEEHMAMHTGERAFSCDECGKDFIRIRHLKAHMKIHTGERAYQCGECGKDFIRRYELKKHMSIHTGERPHKCGECGKAFGRKHHLKEHMKTHA